MSKSISIVSKSKSKRKDFGEQEEGLIARGCVRARL